MLRKLKIIGCIAIASITAANAQLVGSINAFSPYTMYGIGDIAVGGTVASRAMGGIGIALREKTEFNYLNPASLSAIPQQTAIFNFGLINSNYYNQTALAQSAYNSVDMHDLGFAIPITKGVGLGFSLTPYSSVGYNTAVIDENPVIIEDIGRAVYTYYGDGGIALFGTSIGAKIAPGLSIGATMNYAFGSCARYWDATLYSLLNSNTYRKIQTSQTMSINKLLFNFALQYETRVGKNDIISFGITYQPKTTGKFDKNNATFASDPIMLDTIAMTTNPFEITFPEKYAAGVYFTNPKLSIGFDYTRQNWKEAFQTSENIDLGVVNDYRIGAKYTHNRMDFRSFLARLTYKTGARYTTSYLYQNGQQLTEWAVNAGVDVPLKRGAVSNINIALEYGHRGAKQAMLQEQFFKVMVGLKIFAADDMWFIKRKYN